MGDMIDRDAVAKAIATLSQEFLDGGSPTAVKVLNLAMDRVNALPAASAEDVRALTVAQAAKLLLDAMTARPPLADPFDACDVEVERLAIEYSTQGGDAVMVLETAEKFMLAGLRALIPEARSLWGYEGADGISYHVSHNGGTSACYCACADGGPCEHEFSGWRELEDGLGGETFCQRCGMGAMSHSMHTCWE